MQASISRQFARVPLFHAYRFSIEFTAADIVLLCHYISNFFIHQALYSLILSRHELMRSEKHVKSRAQYTVTAFTLI